MIKQMVELASVHEITNKNNGVTNSSNNYVKTTVSPSMLYRGALNSFVHKKFLT